jgi:hypothetical protein
MENVRLLGDMLPQPGYFIKNREYKSVLGIFRKSDRHSSLLGFKYFSDVKGIESQDVFFTL